MINETKKFLDESGVAALYQTIQDQLKIKTGKDDVLRLIQEFIPVEVDNNTDNVIYIYGGSASDLI